MANKTTNKKQLKETKTRNKVWYITKTSWWLLEATWRGFVGWVILTNFDQYAVVAAAIYGLLTAGMIVLVHFFSFNDVGQG